MASSLEHYVNTVTSLSTQGNYAEMVKYLAKSMDVLSNNIANLDTVLATLQPAVHTLGVLAVLKVRLQHTTHTDSSIDTLHATVAEFINVCSEEQIKHAPNLMGELCESYANLLVSGHCPMRGLEVLSIAIRKLQESPGHLTSVHAHLTHLCLVSKCFKPAIKFLDTDLMDIGKECGFYDVKHFLLYYYYGGMIYTAIKNYQRAQYFFQLCICTPAMTISHIMVEAFKKFILVSLIIDGKIENIPKHGTFAITKFLKPLSGPYLKIGSAYQASGPDKITSVVNMHQDIFLRDQNMGLVKQCVNSMYKMNIKRLTRTFITLSLADVANRVYLSSPQEAQKYILNMIEDGEIQATINQRDGMVVFLDNPEKYNSPAMLTHLDKELQMCMSVERQLTSMEEEIMVSPQYIQKIVGPQQDEDPSNSQGQPIGASGSQQPSSSM